MKKSRTSLYLDKDLYKKVLIYACKKYGNYSSFSKLVSELLEKELKEKRTKN